jgi:parallel beta-helix repeat protein
MRRIAEHQISLIAITLGTATLAAVLVSSMIMIIAKQQVPEEAKPDLQNNQGLIPDNDIDNISNKTMNDARGEARVAVTVLNRTEIPVATAALTTNVSTVAANNATIRNNNESDIGDGEEKKDNSTANNSTANNSTANNSTANNSTANNSTANNSTANNSTANNSTNNTNQSSSVEEERKVLTSVSCGQVLTGDAILSDDLECVGTGLIAGKDEITIHLNSHTISLANNTNSTIPELENIGILIPNYTNITITGPGVITGFNKAIEFAGSENSHISNLKLMKNRIGVLLTASNNITTYSTSIDENSIGIASQSSTDSKITFNQIFRNRDQGIVLMDSDYFIISGNSVFGNGNNGVFLDVQSFNHTLSSNIVLNQTMDINNADGVPIDIAANKFIENSCRNTVPDGLC